MKCFSCSIPLFFFRNKQYSRPKSSCRFVFVIRRQSGTDKWNSISLLIHILKSIRIIWNAYRNTFDGFQKRLTQTRLHCMLLHPYRETTIRKSWYSDFGSWSKAIDLFSELRIQILCWITQKDNGQFNYRLVNVKCKRFAILLCFFTE